LKTCKIGCNNISARTSRFTTAKTRTIEIEYYGNDDLQRIIGALGLNTSEKLNCQSTMSTHDAETALSFVRVSEGFSVRF